MAKDVLILFLNFPISSSHPIDFVYDLCQGEGADDPFPGSGSGLSYVLTLPRAACDVFIGHYRLLNY